jgi:predicted nucleic acid-binding protein
MPPLPKAAGIIVCNAGPLIALAGIQQLPILKNLYTGLLVAEAVVHELTGRRVASLVYALTVTGTGGILLAAKQAGLVREIRPLMLQIRANGYFLSARLMDGICQAAGE